ncbi:hypothetical protein FY136_10240 [Agrobacterium tumefaciens]|uniref:hypothetical protein n=1 Tax=Agrobacterium tumefaciens TaxID=358 RepID=UPI0021CDFBE0|nr:hypothetical protein [Agrobacterium tumefaciens]UXT49597.1 hypothetical protein FY136_10240 [Agrobacterium tumefaciens]
MRAYVLGSMLFWGVFFSVWYLLTVYAARTDLNALSPKTSAIGILSASQCSVEVMALFAMSDKLLKAGGPEVPVDLRRNIESCISSDVVSREKLMATQLIRFFPDEK